MCNSAFIFNVSSTLFHLSKLLHRTSVCLFSFIHACTQSSRQTAVQPAQALSQSRWVVQTNHCCSPMLWPTSVPAALTPSSLFFFSFAPSMSHAFLLFPLLFFFFTSVLAKSWLLPISLLALYFPPPSVLDVPPFVLSPFSLTNHVLSFHLHPRRISS